MIKNIYNKGFIAITTVMILSVILLLVASTVGFTGFFTRYNILDSELKKISYSLSESCVNSALLNLSLDTTYSVTNQEIHIDDKKCKILSISNSSGEITIKTQANYKNFYTNLVIIVNESDLSTKSWEEVNTS